MSNLNNISNKKIHSEPRRKNTNESKNYLGNLINKITSTDKELIKSVKVFDVYEGGNIPLEKKSIALNVTIQSSKKTLNDSDLESINNLIIKTVENKTGAKIRS